MKLIMVPDIFRAKIFNVVMNYAGRLRLRAAIQEKLTKYDDLTMFLDCFAALAMTIGIHLRRKCGVLRKLISLLIVSTLSFLLISCNDGGGGKEIIVATSADNPPYEFMENGQIVGFDIDVINAIGNKLGRKIIIENFDFNGLVPALTSKSVNMVIAGLTVSLEREKYVSFSNPYMVTKVSILHRSRDEIKEIKDLENKVIGVQAGTTWAIIAQDLAKQLNIKINYLSNNLILVEELKTEVIDAIILEELQSRKFKENNPELASFSLDEFSSTLAIALEKDSPLIKEINKAISELEKDGTISSIRKKWLPL